MCPGVAIDDIDYFNTHSSPSIIGIDDISRALGPYASKGGDAACCLLHTSHVEKIYIG